MNLTDLKELLDDRAENAPRPVALDTRLAGVGAKVRVSRQRIAGLTALVVVAAGLGATRLPSISTPGTIEAGSPLAEFPEYFDGTHIVDGVTLALPKNSIGVRYDGTGDAVTVFVRCLDLSETWLRTEVTAYGHTEELPCGTGTSSQTFEGHGLTQIFLTVTGAVRVDDRSTVDVPPSGRVIMAVGKPVAWKDYPFPQRPESLADITSDGLCTSPECLFSLGSGDDPTAAVTRTVTWQRVKRISTTVNTPGFLHVRINGVEVGTTASWDYVATNSTIPSLDLNIQPGDEVTVEVIPEHLTGPWHVVLLAT
jgi:hypothetical protein